MLGALRVLTVLFCVLTSVTYSPYSWTQGATKIVLETIRQSDDKSQSFTHTILSNIHGQSVTLSTSQDAEQAGHTRLIAELGSEKLFFVDEVNKDCQQWQANQFSSALGGYMSKLSDRFSVKISAPSFVKLYEKSAAPISGFEVTESGWQLKVDLRFPLLFKKTVWKVTRDLTLWQTEEHIPKTAIPIQSQWLETGFDVIDDLVLDVLEQVPGFTMKSTMVQTIDSNVTTPPVLKGRSRSWSKMS